ncbi:MAG: hypothetical protein RL317_949, partial [Pseudomonadota bacterium]
LYNAVHAFVIPKALGSPLIFGLM